MSRIAAASIFPFVFSKYWILFRIINKNWLFKVRFSAPETYISFLRSSSESLTVISGVCFIFVTIAFVKKAFLSLGILSGFALQNRWRLAAESHKTASLKIYFQTLSFLIVIWVRTRFRYLPFLCAGVYCVGNRSATAPCVAKTLC